MQFSLTKGLNIVHVCLQTFLFSAHLLAVCVHKISVHVLPLLHTLMHAHTHTHTHTHTNKLSLSHTHTHCFTLQTTDITKCTYLCLLFYRVVCTHVDGSTVSLTDPAKVGHGLHHHDVWKQLPPQPHEGGVAHRSHGQVSTCRILVHLLYFVFGSATREELEVRALVTGNMDRKHHCISLYYVQGELLSSLLGTSCTFVYMWILYSACQCSSE